MASGYSIHCGHCGADGDASEWLDPAISKLQEGVIQCPNCKCRVRRRGVRGIFINDQYCPETIELDIEHPPYELLVDVAVDRGPFRKQQKKRK